MKLRGRFTLWFCLAALIPIVTAAFITRSILTDALVDEEKRSQKSAHREMSALLSEMENAVLATVSGMANRNDPYVGGTLLDLLRGGGNLDEYSQNRLRQNGGALMKQLSLDALILLDSKALVLDSPHFEPALGETSLRKITIEETGKRRRKKYFYAMEKILKEGSIQNVLMVQSMGQVAEQGQRLTVIGGRRVERNDFLSLINRSDIQIRIVSDTGLVILAANETWQNVGKLTLYPLRDEEGEVFATIEMRIGNNALPALLRRVTLSSIVLVIGAIILTFFLAYFVARRMTKDLDILVLGVKAAARGELEHQVQIERKDEIGSLGQAFNTMMKDLHDSKERLVMTERVAAWQEIARRLAHEIKNPLTPIQMSMETLRKTYAKNHPSFEEIFEESTITVLEEAARLKRIVTEFSEFARMPKPQKKMVDLNEIVGTQARLVRVTLETESAVLENVLDPSLPNIEADKDLLSQLIMNLISNARDAVVSQENAYIKVTTTNSIDTVVLVVEDNGPGIPSEYLGKLFTPYFTTKHAHGGTGLGLAIAHRIVLDHGGRITADGSPMGGARFRVILPLFFSEE